MNHWKNLLFVVVCATVLTTLLLAPDATTPRTPGNPTHANPKKFENCGGCHLQGGEGPEVRSDHLAQSGKLRVDHRKCYMCHKPEVR